MQVNQPQPEEQKLNLSTSNDDFRKKCQVCKKPYDWDSNRLALKCSPSEHQFCQKCIKKWMKAAKSIGQLPQCPFDRKTFTKEDIISDLTPIDIEEDIRRKNSQQFRENRPLGEIIETINRIGGSILSKSVKDNLIRTAGFKRLTEKFIAAQQDLDGFVGMRDKYIALLERKAWKLRVEIIVKAISLPLEILGLALAPATGGVTLVLSGAAVASRFITPLLLRHVFNDIPELDKATKDCEKLAQCHAIKEFLLAYQETTNCLQGRPIVALLVAVGLDGMACLLRQAGAITETALQFFGSQVFSIFGELMGVLGICLVGVGVAVTGYSIHNLHIQRKEVLKLIKEAKIYQDQLNACMETVKGDPSFIAKIQQESGAQFTDESSVTTSSYIEPESIPLIDSTVRLPSHLNNIQL